MPDAGEPVSVVIEPISQGEKKPARLAMQFTAAMPAAAETPPSRLVGSIQNSDEAERIPAAARQRKNSDSVTLWHQTGKGALQDVLKAYQQVGQTQHKVTEFIDDMAAAYAWADVVVCRSGALTVSEIAAAGLPAIFVPFQHKDRQQYWNALPLEKAGAAKIFEQPQFTADAVAETLRRWDRPTLLSMAEKARQVAIPDATDRVAREVARAAK